MPKIWCVVRFGLSGRPDNKAPVDRPWVDADLGQRGCWASPGWTDEAAHPGRRVTLLPAALDGVLTVRDDGVQPPAGHLGIVVVECFHPLDCGLLVDL